jgi:hypothetical protein
MPCTKSGPQRNETTGSCPVTGRPRLFRTLLASDAKRSTIPVAIVGGGPVGLVLALFLVQYGVRSVLFNSEESWRQHPKGSTHNARTLEHFWRLGISEQVRRLGLPFEHPTDVAYFTRFNRWELARIPMPSEAEKMRAVAAAPVIFAPGRFRLDTSPDRTGSPPLVNTIGIV